MKRHAFTLLELLIAIGLIVILAALAAGGLSYAADKSDEAATIATMKEFEMALEKFKSAKGYYPVLTAKGKIKWADTKWKTFRIGGYYNPEGMATDEDGDKVIMDAYGNGLMYQCPGDNNKNSYDLWSKGIDGIDGNEDDICNWKLK